jgi:hypothetical protein
MNKKHKSGQMPDSAPRGIPWLTLGALVLLAVVVWLGVAWQESRQRVVLLEAELAGKAVTLPLPVVVLPGVSAELDAWLLKSDAELDKADLLELNLLVAKGLPEYSSLDIAACKQQLDKWAGEIRAVLAEDQHTFERAREKWGTRKRFELAVMGSVLMEDHQVRYVDKLDHGNADHKFSCGVLKNNTGTCATLPVIWTALGRRLGHTLSIALMPEHLYCIVQDGSATINIETTGTAHLSMNSDEKLRKMCPPELVKNGTYLRMLSNREMIAVFIGLRGEVWDTRGDVEKALSDYLRAHEISPGNSVIANHLLHAAQAMAQKHVYRLPQTALITSPDELDRTVGRKQYFDVEAINRENQARMNRGFSSPQPFTPSPPVPNPSAPNFYPGGLQ